MNIEDTILQKCNFKYGEHCDFCNNPQGGTYVRSCGEPDDFYWICKKCFENIHNEYPRLDEIQLIMKIDRLQEDLPPKLPF